MANYNAMCIVDFETGGKNPYTCQAMSLACVVVDPVRLQILGDGDFYSLIRASWDEEWCVKNGVEVPSDEALNITGLTREDSEKAPSWQEVHSRFESHVKKFWTGNSVWKAPLFCGFNTHYDLTIINRACQQWGSYDKEYRKNALFHPIHEICVMRNFFQMVENKKGWFSVSLDNIRTALGISKTNAHNSLQDCRDTAAILIKYMKWNRSNCNKLKLEGSFEGLDILDFYDVRPTNSFPGVEQPNRIDGDVLKANCGKIKHEIGI